MRELEAFVKPKRQPKSKVKKAVASLNLPEEDVYDMCDQMLEDLNYLDAQLQNRLTRTT